MVFRRLGYQEGQILIGKLKTKFRKIFRKKESAAPAAEKEMVIQKEEGDVSERPPSGVHPPVRKPSSKRPSSKKPHQGKPSGRHKPKPAEKKSPWDVARFKVPEAEGKVRFHDLGLPSSIMHGIYDLKFSYCTPIQAEILPKALESVDVTGRAQTGTGKSAAFLIAIYTLFLRKPLKGKRRPGCPRALILAPTRELALQITKDAQAIGKYTRSRIITIFGGMDYNKQKRKLGEGTVDLMAATPGRLLDFTQQKLIDLSKVEVLVIDEADRMLDMGFIPDIRNIVRRTPPKDKRQTMLFSATLTPEVIRLTEQWTRNPLKVEIEPEQVESDSVHQIVYIVTSDEKFVLLYNLITQKKLDRVLVFTNMRVEARNLVTRLERYRINCALLSGDVAQTKRLKTLENFKKGRVQILVATDVAARGIHVEGISHVVNYHLPQDPEDYVHRIGRTGRAGASGTSVSFASENDSFYIPAIEDLLGHDIKCEYPDKDLLEVLPKPLKKANPPKSRKPYQKRDHRRANSNAKNRKKPPRSGNYRPRKRPVKH